MSRELPTPPAARALASPPPAAPTRILPAPRCPGAGARGGRAAAAGASASLAGSGGGAAPPPPRPSGGGHQPEGGPTPPRQRPAAGGCPGAAAQEPPARCRGRDGVGRPGVLGGRGARTARTSARKLGLRAGPARPAPGRVWGQRVSSPAKFPHPGRALSRALRRPEL